MDAWAVQGLGFGDEGKGCIVDAIVRQTVSDLVVRFNGGPQASHHVVLDDGRWHAYHQFGAGTFAGANTHLSRFMLVDPIACRREANELSALGVASPLGLMSISPAAVIITPYHQAMNRLRERARGAQRHGSCGLGIGETVSDMWRYPADTITVGDVTRDVAVLLERVRLRKLTEAAEGYHDVIGGDAYMAVLRDRWASDFYAEQYCELIDDVDVLEDQLAISQARRGVVFEGAQGVLLDERAGFAPHNTWTDTTFKHAISLSNETGLRLKRYGVLRSYATRHGAGPFPTEGLVSGVHEHHNERSEWQGPMRTGAFDVVLTRYALGVAPVDALAITHLDCVSSQWPVCLRYTDGANTMDEMVRDGVPVVSYVQSADELLWSLDRTLYETVGFRAYGPTAQSVVGEAWPSMRVIA